MNLTYIIIAVVVIGAFYVISLYNWFQMASMRIRAAIQEIGNQLKRQASLIPNLESAAKGYLKHEKGIYSEITSARKAVDKAAGSHDLTSIEKASDAIGNLIPKLQVLVESNPELQGEKVVSKLMDELRDTSDKLMYSRRVVIDLSADFNQRLVTFPTNMVANLFGFKIQQGLDTPLEGDHVSLSSSEMKDHKVSL